jgi:hypothetical protein
MKAFLSCALIALMCLSIGCKKAEEKQATEPEKAVRPAETKKQQKKKKKEIPENAPLEIYKDKDSVASIPPEQYPTLMTAKIQVGNNEVKGILLKDLLTKYQLQGKNVILGGVAKSATLTWEQATTKEVYVYVGPKQIVQVHSSAAELAAIEFPGRIVKVTASSTNGAAPAEAKKPVKKRRKK